MDLLELDGKRYLVAPRGRTQWVRNAEAAGEITLKKGSNRQLLRLRQLSDGEKLPVLKAYLDNFKGEVQRYFTIWQDRLRKRLPRSLRAIPLLSYLQSESHELQICYSVFAFSLLHYFKSYGIFKHPQPKGRLNLSINMHKSLSGLTWQLTSPVSFRASFDCAN